MDDDVLLNVVMILVMVVIASDIEATIAYMAPLIVVLSEGTPKIAPKLEATKLLLRYVGLM
jgi:hypothetical protein